MTRAIKTAASIISAQTKAIRRRLRKNRSRLIYQVEDLGSEKIVRVRTKKAARRWLNRFGGGYLFEGEQNANWIKAGNLSGIRWNKRRSQEVIFPPAHPASRCPDPLIPF